jgi:hypothetical protein
LTVEILDWRDEHLVGAADLVARRCRDLRHHVPLVPARYERPEVILSLLEGQAHLPGVVAIQDGRLMGFLTGFIIEEFMGRKSAYSPEWANGACGDESGRLYLEMYRHLSARWRAEGCAQHVVTMLAHDQAGVAAWQWLGFGFIVVDAVRGLEPVDGEAAAV